MAAAGDGADTFPRKIRVRRVFLFAGATVPRLYMKKKLSHLASKLAFSRCWYASSTAAKDLKRKTRSLFLSNSTAAAGLGNTASTLS